MSTLRCTHSGIPHRRPTERATVHSTLDMRNSFRPVTFLPERPDRFGELRTHDVVPDHPHLRLDEMPPPALPPGSISSPGDFGLGGVVDLQEKLTEEVAGED
jgi:hypothetical protein